MQMTDTALKPFEPRHLEGACRLSMQAGWPHRFEDWRLALDLSHGLVATSDDGEVVGTILMTPYQHDCATINMVIVDERMRGQGLGRKLMDAAIDLADTRPLRLVATADGLPLYERLGFFETGAIVQHQGMAKALATPKGVEDAVAGDFTAVAALDRLAFGADRSTLIARLADVGSFAVIRRNGTICGFAAIRAFGRGEVVGPVVAANLADAKTLISHFISRRTEQFVRVDTGSDSGLASWLAEYGLVHAGGGIAMARPLVSQPPQAVMTFALTNQALG